MIGFSPDTTNGYSIVYGCDTFVAGAIKLDWMWVVTRSALVVNSAAWTSMKAIIWNDMAAKLPSYNPDTFFKSTISGVSEGCIYTPCTGIEVGLTGCP